MTEIRKDSERIEKSHFQEETVLENYLAGSSRGEVLSQLKEAMQQGVTLLVLTGEEGSGKTTICRLLEQETVPSRRTVFFPRTVDSFEEVVRITAMRLGLDTVIEADGRSIELTLDQIIDFLLHESIDLLIIFDEAENIYLATLERIRKMLDRITQSGVRVHILFSGRDTFLENCDQLSICDFRNTNALHFALTPITKAETAHYLRVEESLKTNGDETSFMVLLENVKEDVDVEGEMHLGKIIPGFTRQLNAYLPWIGGAVCGLLMFIFWLGSGEEKSDVGQVEQTEIVTVVRETVSQVPQRHVTTTLEVAGKLPIQEETKTPVQAPKENAPANEAINLTAPGKPPIPDSDQVQVAGEQVGIGTGEKFESGINDKIEVNEVVELKELPASPQAEPEKAEQLALLPSKPSLLPESIPVVMKAQSQTKVHKIAATTKSNLAADHLYKERLLAGLAWKTDKKADMYTVQLMALASLHAEMNLKKLLAQVDYRQEAGNFYIFKKATAPDNIYVFYGEYPSIERAQLAKNSLPAFLRDHKPYVLSITGALAKTRK